MADKRYDEFTHATPTGSRIILHADASTGALNKCDIDEVNELQPLQPDITLALQLIGSPIIATAVNQSPLNYGGGIPLTSGVIGYCLLYIPACTVTGIWYMMPQTGNYTANNYNGFALYDASMPNHNLIAATPNDGNVWKITAASFGQKAFSAPLTITAGAYYIAFLYSSSAQVQQPQLQGSMNFINGPNLNCGASARIWTYLTGQTTMPATLGPAGNSQPNSRFPILGVY